MNIQPLSNAIKSLVYPGSAIIVGKSPDGESAVTAFFICGINSRERDRVFTADENGVCIKPFTAEPNEKNCFECIKDEGTRISIEGSNIKADVVLDSVQMEFCMSINKQYGRTEIRHTFDYANPEDGTCFILPSLSGSEFPFGAFEGEPIPVSITGSIFDVVADIWENLRPETRVSLWVKSTDLHSQQSISRIINRNR